MKDDRFPKLITVNGETRYDCGNPLCAYKDEYRAHVWLALATACNEAGKLPLWFSEPTEARS